MGTTVDIPEPVYLQLKKRAAVERWSIKELILPSVQEEMGRVEARTRSRVKLPIVVSRRPASLQIDNAKIYAIIPFP